MKRKKKWAWLEEKLKVYSNNNGIEKVKRTYDIKDNTKNIVCGIAASGPTKIYPVNNYIKLFQKKKKFL